MLRDFRFRIQPLLIGTQRRFQLRIGLEGEREIEFIPAYQSAFALRFPLQKDHAEESQAHGERDALLVWLQSQTASSAKKAAVLPAKA